ncbi:MAG TPA: helix-turn-helix transcriptional regulator [Verrucomicrobiae bacterium]
MNITNKLTDAAILNELGMRLRSLRIERNLTREQLAGQAGISRPTVDRLETGTVATQLTGFIRVCRVLGILDRFDLLVPETAPGPMMQLKLRGKERRRASRINPKKSPARKWQWGDEP